MDAEKVHPPPQDKLEKEYELGMLSLWSLRNRTYVTLIGVSAGLSWFILKHLKKQQQQQTRLMHTSSSIYPSREPHFFYCDCENIRHNVISGSGGMSLGVGVIKALTSNSSRTMLLWMPLLVNVDIGQGMTWLSITQCHQYLYWLQFPWNLLPRHLTQNIYKTAQFNFLLCLHWHSVTIHINAVVASATVVIWNDAVLS